MPLTFSFFEILIIIGITQGLVTSFLLLTSHENPQSKRILGITVFVFCLANCRVLLHTTGLWETQTFRYFPFGMELFLAPLVYLYILSLTQSDFRFKPRLCWHFLFGTCYAGYDLLVYLLSLTQNTLSGKDRAAKYLYFSESNVLEDYLIVIVTLTYVFLGYKTIRDYLHWIAQFKQYKTLPIYSWLKSLIFWSCVVGSVLAINQLLDTLSWVSEYRTERWRFFHLLLAFVTYYLGFMGYKKDGLKVHLTQTNLTTLAKKLDNTQHEKLEQRLINKLEVEAVYREPSLTLKDLASDLDITAETLSMVVNQKFEMGFRDLINSYRIKQVKELLQQNTEASVLDIALEAGFNSQASFYRAFKKHEGVTPKIYLSKLQ